MYKRQEYVCKISWSNSKKRREEFPGTQFLAFNLNQPVYGLQSAVLAVVFCLEGRLPLARTVTRPNDITRPSDVAGIK